MSTACARYKVRKFLPDSAPHGRPDFTRYQSWDFTGLYPQMISGHLASFADAQALCEARAQKAAA